MADKMTYQEARRIRNKDYSLGRLITSNIRQGGGVGESIKEAFKEKFDIKTRTKAKITGIKEKFDPLNIAKFLTFGSNVAPAILGRLTGRSKADIANFTGGRAKPYETATKIGKLEGDDSGLTDILDKIYTFMKSNQEDDIRHQELQNNRREEEMNEDAIRHKKLLEALAKLTGNKVDKDTASKIEPEDTGSLFDKFMNILGVSKEVWAIVRGLGSMIFMNPAILVALGAIGLAGGIYYLIKANIDEAKGRDSAAAAGNLQELRKLVESQPVQEGGDLETTDEKMKRLLKVANTKESLAALAKMESGGEQIDKNSDSYREKFNQSLMQQGYKKNLWTPGYNKNDVDPTPEALAIADAFASGKKITSETPVTPTPPSAVPSAPTSTPPPTSATPESPTTKTPTALPESMPNAGQQLVNATNENNNAKLADLTSSPATNAVSSSSTNVAGKSSSSKQPLPPVRNLEDTFQRMIMNSTRVV